MISSCLRSSADIMPPLPRSSTCQRPVRPAGAMKRSMLESTVSFSASYRGNGRLTTMDMSPFNMLKSCGSSSMLYLRINLPTLVTRGSFSILTKALLFSYSFSLLKSDSATTMSSPTSMTSSSLIIMSDSIPMSIIIISASSPKGAVMTLW